MTRADDDAGSDSFKAGIIGVPTAGGKEWRL